MPSPGISQLKTDFAVPYTVEGGFSTSIILDSTFNVAMATGMHNGWTCASPTTGSTFQSAIISAFTGYTLGTGQGLHWITCIGSALDAEVALWTASWDSNAMIHTYTPTAGSIITTVQACELYTSNARTKLDTTIANAFIAYFVQEVG